MALPFGAPEAQQPRPRPQPQTLLEFRAGRMAAQGKSIRPDVRKGLIRLTRTEDQLLHFQWLDRSNNAVEEDQIVFPDEAVFQKVQQSSGRVYQMKFKQDERRFFFWMQDPKVEGDATLCSTLNRHINNQWMEAQEEHPPDDQMSEDEEEGAGGGGGGGSSGQQPPPSAAKAGGGGAAAQGGAVQMADLQSVLASLGQLGAPGSGGPVQQSAGPSLVDVLKPEAILPLLRNDEIRERLATYLPEDLRSEAEMARLVRSPQFLQQVQLFSHAIQSGQVDWFQFGVDPSQYGLSMASFLQAMEDQANRAEREDEAIFAPPGGGAPAAPPAAPPGADGHGAAEGLAEERRGGGEPEAEGAETADPRGAVNEEDRGPDGREKGS